MAGDRHGEARSIVNIAAFVLFCILCLLGVIGWGFQYFMLAALLVVRCVAAVYTLAKGRQKPYKRGRSILAFARNVLLVCVALALALIFPQYKAPVLAGGYEVATARYTWVDDSRVEAFEQGSESRSLTVEFWYPADDSQSYPLVVFSHGAFGFSGSNASTCESLAANGYVVASVNHKYHAFYDIDTDGSFTLVDFEFLNTVAAQSEGLSTGDERQERENAAAWLALRTEDLGFVLDTIATLAKRGDSEGPFAVTDTEAIGLFGHSLGGAASAQLGRQRGDIGAVVNLDGTLIGDRLGYTDEGVNLLNDEPYPVPMLGIYSQYMFDLAVQYEGDSYVNFNTGRNSDLVTEFVFEGAGHLNFTDLPLFSPALAGMLGEHSVMILEPRAVFRERPHAIAMLGHFTREPSCFQWPALHCRTALRGKLFDRGGAILLAGTEEDDGWLAPA